MSLLAGLFAAATPSSRTNTPRRLFIVCIVSVLSSPALGNDYSVVPQQFVYCTTCHGVELQGNRAVDAPKLNGMEDWYVRNQLHAFREGWRGTHNDLIGMEMRPQATVLDADGIDAAVAFVASVPDRSRSVAATIDGDARRGESLYATCAACHGNKAEGNVTLNAPRLVGQSDWYLARQLEKFRSGIRGGNPGDIYGSQMRASASVLTDETAISDVVAYINSLQ